MVPPTALPGGLQVQYFTLSGCYPAPSLFQLIFLQKTYTMWPFRHFSTKLLHVPATGSVGEEACNNFGGREGGGRGGGEWKGGTRGRRKGEGKGGGRKGRVRGEGEREGGKGRGRGTEGEGSRGEGGGGREEGEGSHTLHDYVLR